MFFVTPVVRFFRNLYVLSWDVLLALINLVLPKRRVGNVARGGYRGDDGKWPDYIAPKEGDSRSACPALNALSNHGILPRNGRNISFKEMNETIRQVYNFAPSFCYYVPHYSADMLNKSYGKDRFDLEDISLHNGIEHDASLTREDVAIDKDQGKPYIPFIRELLASASGKDAQGNPLLTVKDLTDYSAKRRIEASTKNPDYSLAFIHKVFSASNSSTLLTIFGGRVKDLEPILLEERLPDGWESRVRKPMGLTIAAFNTTVMRVAFGVNEKKAAAALKAQAEPSTQNDEAQAQV
ncbi:hypothetical protein AMATHDRAFT_143332 [Amanita thiersii Skay4041]|uniref:Heme haloperoxidase family profile domain-containing protein n=1 Tax=Amanita thiersii Skay4041 TaxID=703135 RepID=A0A2A9NM54_9AGAR|nr:hypothetical protein AMATHDRAFT_143332 [Amanita thiersii Skay4041]